MELVVSIIGWFDDLDVLRVDAEGGFVADVLRGDVLYRARYTPERWVNAGWTRGFVRESAKLTWERLG